MRRNLLVFTLAVAGAAAIATLLSDARTPGISPSVLLVLRWAALTGLVGYAVARRSLTTWILLGLLAGAEIGHDAPATALRLQILGQIFLRLIKTIVAPLLFGTLVSGIAGHADLKKVGRLGIKALIFFEAGTTLALFIGLAAINVTRAGEGVSAPPEIGSVAPAVARPGAAELILRIFPENIAKSVSDAELLQVVVFSLIFGVALGLVKMEKRRPVLAFAESLAETMFKFTNIVMLFAPFGVAGAMAYTVAHNGLGMLGHLLTLVGALYAALAVFLLLVLLPVALLARVPLRPFLRAMAEPATIAFATSSSEAALPRAMEETEALGVPRSVVAFIIPLGYSFNLTGTTLYLALAAIFVAQAGGLELGLGRQMLIMLALMLASKGVAGVSRGAIVVLLGMAPALGLPAAPVFMLLGIDPLMDMGRTAVNVIGNCLAAVVIARWERIPMEPVAGALENHAV
ncbi:MAG TPA: cation:dicarboxylase symporter family transporter [Terriglobia bacterium]|jgi:proton glutamate symport protein|nr:cation:dicarboxylase symporter family transporter [Terriglobia bacterium]